MSFNRFTFSTPVTQPQEPQADTILQSYTYQWIDSNHLQYANVSVNVGKERLSLLRLSRSDGAFGQVQDGINKNGDNTYYLQIRPDSADDVNYRKQVADKLAKLLGLQLLPGTAGFILYEWPQGYAPYKKVVSDLPRAQIDMENPRRTRYKHVDNVVFGHPKGIGYDKSDKLVQHFLWLAQDHEKCACGKCTRMRTEPRPT